MRGFNSTLGRTEAKLTEEAETASEPPTCLVSMSRGSRSNFERHFVGKKTSHQFRKWDVGRRPLARVSSNDGIAPLSAAAAKAAINQFCTFDRERERD